MVVCLISTPFWKLFGPRRVLFWHQNQAKHSDHQLLTCILVSFWLRNGLKIPSGCICAPFWYAVGSVFVSFSNNFCLCSPHCFNWSSSFYWFKHVLAHPQVGGIKPEGFFNNFAPGRPAREKLHRWTLKSCKNLPLQGLLGMSRTDKH